MLDLAVSLQHANGACSFEFDGIRKWVTPIGPATFTSLRVYSVSSPVTEVNKINLFALLKEVEDPAA